MRRSLFRLEDTGMGLQMQEYAVSQVLHWFRRFDDYQALKNPGEMAAVARIYSRVYRRDHGAGVLGAKVAESLQAWGSHCAAGVVRVNHGLAWKASPVLRNWARF